MARLGGAVDDGRSAGAAARRCGGTSLRIPQFSQLYLNGVLIGVRHAVRGGVGFTLLALAIALVFGVWKPRWMRPPVVALLVVCGLGMIGAGEYLREFVRKPWVINQVIYANDLRAAQVETLQTKGVSHTREFPVDGRHGKRGVRRKSLPAAMRKLSCGERVSRHEAARRWLGCRVRGRYSATHSQ